ncbi:hypothetical protein [Neobacillus sp. LXY-4]|uniref:hypothetical protein n=1 Tax=Neobacillus sp. LXY-4 TaxID=3379826 RepID=UPI003EE1B6B7
MNNNWMKMLINLSKNGFGRRRNNRGIMWASLIGLGMSAATYFMGRNQNRNDRTTKLQGLMQNFQQTKNAGMPNFAGLTEFAEEITPKPGASANHNSGNTNNNFSQEKPNENPLN